MERVEVQAHVRRAFAVEAGEEVLQQLFLRQFGVPHPLRLEPRLEFGELGVLPLVGALFVDVVHLVLAEEAEVVLQTQHVGERGRVVGEVRAVVPDVHLLADRPPALDVVHELDVFPVGALRDRVREVALDGAEARHHVRARLDVLRRLARVLVGERLDDRAGKLLLDGFGDLVDESDHRARVRLLAVVDLLALRTGAEIVPVVLADAVEGGAGILADAFQHVGGDDAQDVRIREAELCVILQAFSVHLAEVFGVLVEILVGRTEHVERVAGMEAASVAVRRAAVLRLERHPLAAVHAVAAGEVRVADHVRPERLTHQEGGFLRVVEGCRHGEYLNRRHLLAPTGIPAAPAVPFQQFIDAVQDAAVASRLHQQTVSLHDEMEGVARKVLPSLREYDGVFPVGRCGRDGQFNAGHALRELLEFLCRVALRFGRRGRQHDHAVRGLAPLRDDEWRRADVKRASQRCEKRDPPRKAKCWRDYIFHINLIRVWRRRTCSVFRLLSFPSGPSAV